MASYWASASRAARYGRHVGRQGLHEGGERGAHRLAIGAAELGAPFGEELAVQHRVGDFEGGEVEFIRLFHQLLDEPEDRVGLQRVAVLAGPGARVAHQAGVEGIVEGLEQVDLFLPPRPILLEGRERVADNRLEVLARDD